MKQPLSRMTLQSLRALARKKLGAAAARLTTREALVRALSGAGGKKQAAATPARKRSGKPKPGAKAAAKVGAKRAARTATPAAKPAARKPAPRAARAKPPRAGARRSKPAALSGDGEGATDPAGFFVARVRGEDAVREAPHPLVEARLSRASAATLEDEQLGELPASYGEDTLVLLPRDPTSLFAYWDQAEATLREAFRGLERPRVQLWLWARAGDGWERVRVVDLALESRGYYLHGLEPGRSYRAELRAVDGPARERAVGPGSAEVTLPPSGPSPIVDDRVVRIPWDQPLGPPVGPGWRAAELPFEARDALADLSAWPGESGPVGSAGFLRPTSSRPTSPGGGEEDR